MAASQRERLELEQPPRLQPPRLQPTRRQPTRRQLGAWYTPPALVEALVDGLGLDHVQGSGVCGAVRVLDPACGDGRFLVAVAAALAARGRRVELTGVELDPGAAVFGSPLAARCIRADALAMSWDGAAFDVVVGNPPFLNQLATATTRGGSSRWGGGAYANSAAEFLALAMTVTRRGGRIGLVLPQSLLATRDAAPIRIAVDDVAALRWMWWAPTSVFTAQVRTWAGAWEVGGLADSPVARCYGPAFEPTTPAVPPADGSWSSLIAGVDRPTESGLALGSIATFSADFRDQYYGLIGAVGDEMEGPPLVTCGLIEPGRCLWGERPVRFAKRRFAAPCVDLARLSSRMQQWAATRLVPKILVANQTRRIESVHDPVGEWLPSVPVISCVTAEPARVLDVLGSAAATEWVRYHAAGSGLSAAAVRLTPRLLASIPLP